MCSAREIFEGWGKGEKYIYTGAGGRKRRKKRGKKGEREGVESVGVRGNTHGRNEICAQTSSSRPNVNPIFPGITSGPRGEEEVGERWLQGGRARALLDKRSFFHFSWRR